MTLARIPLLRLLQSRQAWVSTTGWFALVLGSAWLQRRHGAVHGADHALELYASVAVPLLVYGLVGVTVGRRGLAASGRPLVRLGASPGQVALRSVLVTALASALISGLMGAATVALAHGAGDPPVLRDALQTLGFGALAGAAYAAYLMVGAAFVRGFWGRGLLLALDWALGDSDGVGALLTPRAHLQNLLGGEGPLETLPWESLALLATIAVACAALAVRRAARTRV